MARQMRKEKLLQIIEENDIETQQDLMEALRLAGFDVTQATVSRDIQDLGLIKVTTKNSRSHYAKPLDPKLANLTALFRQAVISVEGVNNLIVIKTISGSANSAGSLIDKFDNKAIMGTIAGDDTILIIVRSADDVNGIVKHLKQLME